jgi:hypothetical protein
MRTCVTHRSYCVHLLRRPEVAQTLVAFSIHYCTQLQQTDLHASTDCVQANLTWLQQSTPRQFCIRRGGMLGSLHESSACISGTSTSVRVLVICVVTEPFHAFVHGQYSNESECLR